MADDEEKTPAEQLRCWLDTNGNDFCGTGLTFQEFLQYEMIKRVKSSFVTVFDRIEERRRLNIIMDLSVAIHKLGGENRSYFAIRWAESGIKHVILGEWDELKLLEKSLLFEDESESLREEVVPAYEEIRSILRRAYEGVPIQSEGVGILLGGKWNE